ncbi:aminotransferase class III-fold pyridoxal phosphate-dependent enzyme [Geobacter pelophilus]|uniref:Aminotransferase class III-fold pyridoxal phosphate-dependent enzyme n=1 Tax=Geoanaerobacter pelophilus TaxID=60036 RepID=A0AAW4KZD7_9BACT|nr:aminotransferase class III-fold pyridoxal phosphate-dependent enzyme [Geoanaerobacter pelophilus]MBT0663928.1 aminotransferase class III-fold pyridoxal phosphate-dependent enzyme [Geoanaerobacter pelophilus]
MGTGQKLYDRAKGIIPGGTQLLSKRPEMFLPEQWPAYYQSAKGITVTDLDGNSFIDMSIMGVGACILGYGDPDVDAAAKSAIDNGVMCTLNAPEEVELAELLCELHPWASMVRYARSGGEAMSLAIRIARAHTGREKVAFCGYHGWTDWYLAANLGADNSLDGHLMPGLDPAGVPSSLRNTAFPFHFNQIDQLKDIVSRYGKDLAVIVMEPGRETYAEDDFVTEVREIATSTGAVLIFDEITTGFRMTAGGIHLLQKVNPDIAVFAKAMANGYAMSAVIGTSEVMESVQSTFISSTNWTERIGPSASIATIKKYRKENVAAHLIEIGTSVMKGWEDAAHEAGIKLHASGLPSLNHFSFEHPEEVALTTLFIQLMLERGYLAFNQFKPSFAHKKEDISSYMRTVSEVFALLKEAIDKNDIKERLNGPVARRGFYRLTSAKTEGHRL